MNSIDHFVEILMGLLGSFITAAIGVMMRHGHQAAQGIPWSWNRIFLDAPTVLLMGITGGALGQYLEGHYGFPEVISWALAGNFGYIGPQLVDRVASYLEKKGGE